MDRDEVIKKLYEEHPIDKIVEFNELDISDKLTKNAQYLTIYTEHFNREKAVLEQLIAIKDKIIGERYDHYRFNFDKELKPSEIEKYYLPKDQKILKINQMIQQQQWRVDFFGLCVKAIEKMQWNMKTYLDSLKI